MGTEFSPEKITPSRYTSDELSPPISVRLPATLLEDLDKFVEQARNNGYPFVNRAFVLRDSLEAYLGEDDHD